MDLTVERNTTTFLCAAKSNDLETLRELIGKGINVNVQNDVGKTALMTAVLAGHTNAITLLLESGAKVDTRNVDGLTALHWAASQGREDILQLLLNSSPDAITVMDNDERSALYCACYEGHKECVEVLLLFPGCDVNAQDKSQHFPEFYICSSDEAPRDPAIRDEIRDLIRQFQVKKRGANSGTPNYTHSGAIRKMSAPVVSKTKEACPIEETSRFFQNSVSVDLGGGRGTPLKERRRSFAVRQRAIEGSMEEEAKPIPESRERKGPFYNTARPAVLSESLAEETMSMSYTQLGSADSGAGIGCYT